MVSLSDLECQSTTQRALAIAPKITGLISFLSSSFIILHVIRDKRRRTLTYHRLLLGMSISDFFSSFTMFLSTWPIPRGEACLAAGTTMTCTAQGFVGQTTALCTPTYNLSLAIYYLLVIVRGWNEKRVSKIEKYLHALPILAGFGTGFAGLVLKLYNNAGWCCWIAPAPNNPERDNPNYFIFRLAFLYADAWAIIIILAICMFIIYFHVLKQERKLDKYGASFAQKKRYQSKKIRNQAFLYVGCVYITWIFGTVFRFVEFAGKRPPTFISVLFVTFFPLQGFFNLVVYMSPRIIRHYEYEGGTSLSNSNFFDVKRSNLSSLLFTSARSRVGRVPTRNGSQNISSIVEGAEIDGVEALEENVEGRNDNDTVERGAPGEQNEVDVEEDYIDELENIVEV